MEKKEEWFLKVLHTEVQRFNKNVWDKGFPEIDQSLADLVVKYLDE